MNKIKSNPTKTALTISMGFLVVYFIFRDDWALFTSLGIGLTGIFSTYLSKLIEKIWFKLAWVLSLIVPNILLTSIFYGILFPIAILQRIFAKSDNLKLKNSSNSTFTTCKKEYDKKSFENPW